MVRAHHKIIWTGQDYPTGIGDEEAEKMMGRQHKEWTGLEWNSILWKVENRKEYRKLIIKSMVVPQRSARLWDR